MKKQTRCIAWLIALVGLFAQSLNAQTAANEPPELVSTRSSYQQKIKAATDPINQQYAQYLEALKKNYGAKGDVDAVVAIQKELEGLGMPLGPTSGKKEAKIVIWNQNNGGKGDRGTSKVNIILSANGRVVWRKNGFRLQWDPNKQTKEELAVPSVDADMLRVEITELVNEKGGLAEIEYLKDGQNLALGGKVAVSGFWENNPAKGGGMLNDGLRETFWLLNDKLEGWAEITLKPTP